MGYIGNTPAEKFQTLDKQSFSVSATTGYTLSNAVTSPQEIALFINNVRQNPNSSYSVSGTSLTLSAATASGDTMYCVFLGKSVGTVAPALSSVTRKMLASPWQAIQTSAFTAVAGYAYMCNTTSSAFTVTLPGSASVGDVVQIVDYAGTFTTNNITLTSSAKIEGGTANKLLGTNREGVTITFVDTTQGWVATSGVNEGSRSLTPIPYAINFLVLAGGAAGGGGNPNNSSPNGYVGAGGGAGGYRTSTQTIASGTQITITVGDGGSAVSTGAGTSGSDSSISGSSVTTITSAGGGGGGANKLSGVAGGSGGGAGAPATGSSAVGAGNTPSTSPSQGNNGGSGFDGQTTNTNSGGGGGAGAVGANASSAVGGSGGAGASNSITGSAINYAGGGGGVTDSDYASGGLGGSGGGGNGARTGGTSPGSGTANLGGGGGGARLGVNSGISGAGGKGVVILSVPTSSYSTTTSGSPTVSTSGSNTIMKFTGSGSYTA